MLGLRGASRYYSELYKEAFTLECNALKKARDIKGFKNIKLMLPFVRTPEEALTCLTIMKKNGLVRKKDDLDIIMMCEIPSNVIMIDEFSAHFDGFSIGSNDLTQLTLGIDRDDATLAQLFDERDESVKRMITLAIKGAHKNKRTIGICGQAPSDFPEFGAWLIQQHIDSISLNPDAVIPFIQSQKTSR
jgi:pyruvate, water dikinase